MAVPAGVEFDAASKVAAHTAFRDLIDSGSGAGLIRVRDAADVLLATITLSDPCGSVNGTTGLLTFGIAARDESADASGTIAYVQFCDSTGAVRLAMPAQAGSSAVSGKAVFNTLSVIAGGPVEMLSATVG